MTLPRVSVVIPVYNRPDDVARAAASALAQTGVMVEVVIVDDASQPRLTLPSHLAEDARVTLVSLEANGGAAAARNAGVAAARSDWIAFLDSDDWFLPGKLAAQMTLANAADPLSVIVCGVRYLRLETGAHEDILPIPASDVSAFCSGCWFCPGSTALLHKEALLKIGPLDTRLRRLEDLDWFIRLGQAGGRIVTTPVIGALINVGANAAPVHVDTAARIISETFLTGGGVANRRLSVSEARRLRAYLALERAAARWKSGQRLVAFGLLLRSILMVPRLRLHLENWWTRLPKAAGQKCQ